MGAMADVLVPAAWALLSAALLALSLALSQRAHLATMGSGSRRRAAVGFLVHPAWLASVGLAGLGFVTHAVALGVGSLALVETVQVTQLLMTAAISRRVTGARRAAGEGRAVVLVAAGLVGLVSLMPGSGTATATAGGLVTGTVVVAMVVVVLAVGGVRRPPRRAALLGAAAGVLFALQAATVKQAIGVHSDGASSLGGVATITALGAIGLVGVAGGMLQAVALRCGRLSTVHAAQAVLTPATAMVLGATLFGEPVRTGAAVVSGGLGAVACVGGLVLLGRATATDPVVGIRAGGSCQDVANDGAGANAAGSDEASSAMAAAKARASTASANASTLTDSCPAYEPATMFTPTPLAGGPSP